MNTDYQTQSASTATMTVYQATYTLPRQLGLTRIFGNPGSTEQPFLKNFPTDFQYVLRSVSTRFAPDCDSHPARELATRSRSR